ncbi:MAG: cytochrome C peroxidase [Fulvimarina sp.]|nr:cytochrome C peroxidase [Fulvimarina sp.]
MTTRIQALSLSAAAFISLAASAAWSQESASEIDDLRSEAKESFGIIPAKPPELSDNPATPAKLELGKMLWFETRLSKSGVISCNSCHELAAGGTDNIQTSLGHGWQKGPRNSPTVFNSVFNTAQFWDGRAVDLRAQAAGPIQAAVEMDSTQDFVVAVLSSIPDYRERFAKAFPGEATPLTFENVTKAIEVFEATLITPNSPFDRFLAGDDTALSAAQRRGLRAFMDAGCGGCHSGSNFGGQDYFPFGVVERPGSDILPPDDKGRFAVTHTASDEYVFRAPPLRNVRLTAPYFHSGRVWDLTQAVQIMGTSQLGSEIGADDAQAIVDFLGSLDGDRPTIVLPALPPSTAETPRPSAAILPTPAQ